MTAKEGTEVTHSVKAGEFLDQIRPVPHLEYKEYDMILRQDTFNRISKATCPEFIIPEDAKKIFEESIKYFAGDPTCEYNLNKGLFIYGNVGVGKTLYFKIFQSLTKALKSPNTFQMLSVNDLVDGFATRGHKYFLDAEITPIYKRSERLWSKPPHLMLDDLGQSGKTVSYFGTQFNVIEDFFARRYNVHSDYFSLTHISTNLTPGMIKKEYSPFILSRMRQMFNFIMFPGTDKRK